MSKLFDEWKDDIEAYCKANKLSFEKAQKSAKSCGKCDIALQYYDKEKGMREYSGVIDDSNPAPITLWIRKNEDGEITFEQTEYTQKYLGID